MRVNQGTTEPGPLPDTRVTWYRLQGNYKVTPGITYHFTGERVGVIHNDLGQHFIVNERSRRFSAGLERLLLGTMSGSVDRLFKSSGIVR